MEQFLKKKTNDQKEYKKIFNILQHKGNADQNLTEIPCHPSHNGNHEENKQQMLAGMWGEGTLTHCWWGL
jgi:hypothetical protein